jgi:hypothetical protein
MNSIHFSAFRRLILKGLFSTVIVFPIILHAQINHSGGPDNFGYHWIDSDTTGGPDFYWVDISTMGTPGPTGDDDCSLVNLPFTFPFYGQDKTSVNISTNGYLTFGHDGTDYSSDPIPDLLDPNDHIAPFWHDLAAGTSDSTIHYYHDINQNQFIVQYTNVPAFDTGGSNSFQVILHSDGSIVFQYLTMAKTVFLTGNLDARMIPEASVWTSVTPLLMAADSSYAWSSASLNDLAQTSFPLVAGDAITIAGTLPDGTAVFGTFTYATSGTTVGDLLDVINMFYGGQAMTSIWDGKIRLTDILDNSGRINGTYLEAGDSHTQISLSSAAGIALPAFENSVQGFTGRTSFTTDVYDGLGFSHSLVITFTKTIAAGEWRWEVEFMGGDESILDGSSGTVNFNASGEVVSLDVDGTATGIVVDPGTGAANFTIQLDAKGGKGLAGVTQFASEANLEVTLATIGIENSSGTDGLAVTNNGSHRHDNIAIQFEPPAGVGITGILNFPSGFSLEQNYPNPFNPSTVINYALPVTSAVVLSIYDLMGREIRVWRVSEQQPGYHYVQWSVTDSRQMLLLK